MTTVSNRCNAFQLHPMSLRLRQALSLGTLLGFAGTALAGEPHQHHELQATVITAVQQDSPLKVVTDPKAPRQPVPATDATDYLKTIPGFSAIRSGGSNGDPVLRGMFGSRLNMLANGGQMIGACPSRMDAPSSYIVPATYDQLTVIKGPQTVLWGPGASAGTVRFEREPERFAEPGSRLDASLLVGSRGRLDKLVDGAVGSEQGYMRVIGSQARADDYRDGNDDTLPSRWEKWSGDVALGWTPDVDTLIEVSAGRGDGESRYAGRGMDASKLARESLGLRFHRENLGGLLSKVEGNLYYNYADHVMDNYSLRTPDATGSMPMPMASNVDRRTLGGRLAATLTWQDVELIAGVDAQRSERRARRSSYDMMSATLTPASAFAWNKDAGFHNYGAFAEATWHVAEGDRVIAGGRLDRAWAKDYRQSIRGMMGSRPNPTAGVSRAETLPSGFARYEHDLSGWPATLYAGLGHVQRMPDYWELFSPTMGPQGAANAFEGIQPEKTTQLDVGLQYRGERLDAWVSGYVGQVRDYILYTYTTGMMGSTSRADNVDARIMGGELGTRYQWTDHWTSDATLAYAWGKNSSSGAPLAQMPPLEARLGLTYEQPRWSAGALWRVVAAQHRVSEGQGNVVGKDFGDSSGFAVFSLNAAYRFSDTLKVSTGLDNLFDKTYSEHLNLAGNSGFGFLADDPQRINEPGRTLWAKVDVSF